MNWKKCFLLIGFIVISLGLIGCSGGGGGQDLPSIETNSLSGIVYAPTATTGLPDLTLKNSYDNILARMWQYVAGSKVYALPGETPLSNASVIVVYYGTNEPVRNQNGQEIVATTDVNGNYTIDGIPSGETVEIIVTKDLDTGEQVYMSAIIPDVGNTVEIGGDPVGNVNAATTLATILIREERSKGDTNISADDLGDVINSAKQFTNGQNLKLLLDAEDSHLLRDENGNILVNEDNIVNGLAYYQNLKNKCKEIIENSREFYYPAKSALEDVRQSGIFLGNTAYKQVGVISHNMTQTSDLINTITSEFNTYFGNIITERFIYVEPNKSTPYEIADLPREFPDNTGFEIYPEGDWTWTLIDKDTTSVTYGFTVEVRLTNLNEIMYEEDGYTIYNLEEADFDYIVNNENADYYFNASLSLVSTNGTELKAISETEKIIIPLNTEFSIDGIYRGVESGTVDMDMTFAAETNSSDLLSEATVSYSGSLIADHITINGNIILTASGSNDLFNNDPVNASLSFSGLLETSFPEEEVMPRSVEPLGLPRYTSSNFKSEIENLEINFEYNDYEEELLANSISFSGMYMDKNPTTNTWNGDILINLDNSTEEYQYLAGSFDFTGLVEHVEFNGVQLVLSADVNKPTEGENNIDIEFNRGDKNINGTINITNNENNRLLIIDLENQDGVRFLLSYENGSIDTDNSYMANSEGKKMAEIVEGSYGVPEVYYLNEEGNRINDNNQESFELLY